MKVLGIAFLLYWLIHFVSTSFKVGEAFVSIAVYVGFIAWMKHQRVMRLRLADIDDVDQMEGAGFLQRMMVHFHDLGLKAQGAKGKVNFGADIIVTGPGRDKVVVHCKQCPANESVDIDAVQAVIGAIRYYNAQSAMVITNRNLTKAARELARVNDVEVWERDELAKNLVSVVDWKPSFWSEVKAVLGELRHMRK